MNSKMLSYAGRFFVFSLAASSVQAIPVPQPQTPDASSLESCPTDGGIVCSPDGASFYICDWGKAVPMGPVAAGNTCKDGQIMSLDSNGNLVPAPSQPPVAAPSPAPAMTTPAPAPVAPAPVNPPPADDSSDTITSTITSIVEAHITRSSTIVVTMTGTAPTDVPAPSSEAPAPPANGGNGNPIQLTEEQVLAVAPTSNTCSGAEFPNECATASDAVANINKAFATYGIDKVGPAAAILSIMAFESADFKYNINHFPGRAGQGTKAMLMPNFIVQYAQTFGSTDSIAPGLTPANIDSQSDDIKNKVRELVLGIDKTFGAAVWFYSTCPEDVKQGLEKAASLEAWSNYITQCVKTTVTDDRQAGFTKAVAALSR
ncbi:hypothetical protein TWF696_000368 [Orbilia brochopaga]|uniref:Uncharacterized protein n=1 Tax=Orbilia brochopaga TaxID=3140254 RepID=A0AAV9VDV2_9PEZI